MGSGRNSIDLSFITRRLEGMKQILLLILLGVGTAHAQPSRVANFVPVPLSIISQSNSVFAEGGDMHSLWFTALVQDESLRQILHLDTTTLRLTQHSLDEVGAVLRNPNTTFAMTVDGMVADGDGVLFSTNGGERDLITKLSDPNGISTISHLSNDGTIEVLSATREFDLTQPIPYGSPFRRADGSLWVISRRNTPDTAHSGVSKLENGQLTNFIPFRTFLPYLFRLSPLDRPHLTSDGSVLFIANSILTDYYGRPNTPFLPGRIARLNLDDTFSLITIDNAESLRGLGVLSDGTGFASYVFRSLPCVARIYPDNSFSEQCAYGPDVGSFYDGALSGQSESARGILGEAGSIYGPVSFQTESLNIPPVSGMRGGSRSIRWFHKQPTIVENFITSDGTIWTLSESRFRNNPRALTSYPATAIRFAMRASSTLSSIRGRRQKVLRISLRSRSRYHQLFPRDPEYYAKYRRPRIPDNERKAHSDGYAASVHIFSSDSDLFSFDTATLLKNVTVHLLENTPRTYYRRPGTVAGIQVHTDYYSGTWDVPINYPRQPPGKSVFACVDCDPALGKIGANVVTLQKGTPPIS